MVRRAEVSREQWGIAFGISAMVAAIPVPVAAQINVWVGVSTAIVRSQPLRAITSRMPGTLQGAQQRRPVLSLAWLVLVLVAVGVHGRLIALRAKDVGETDQRDNAEVRMMRGNETARSNCRI